MREPRKEKRMEEAGYEVRAGEYEDASRSCGDGDCSHSRAFGDGACDSSGKYVDFRSERNVGELGSSGRKSEGERGGTGKWTFDGSG